MGLDAGGEQFRARHQIFAGLAARAFDAAGNGLDARAEQVFELRDAGVDVAGDQADAGLDALMDVLEAGRDGVGQVRRRRRWCPSNGRAAGDGLGQIVVRLLMVSVTALMR